ncbi:MAG: hypothetical protein HUJ54_06020 [Erysipelotrichaceae bacterium]|nr:hypothetical protein [Erysipelotrichaceae bacterium]
MKKTFTLLAAAFLAAAAVLTGCSAGSNKVMIQDGVNFKLMDVLKVTNPDTNAVYYYYLAQVTNTSDSVYHMSTLTYYVSEENRDHTQVTSIDKSQQLITNDLYKNQSTSVYGYVGFPNSKNNNYGIYFPNQKQFVSFNSVSVRNINDKDLKEAEGDKFTAYEDSSFAIEVDTSNMKYSYKDGNSKVEGLIITYKNKTKNMLVVPYLTPVGKMEGLELKSLPDPDKLKSMSLEELKKQDFSQNGLAPKTTSIEGEAKGYQMYYLPAGISLPSNISIEFDGAIPDFSTPGGLSVVLKSAALGYSQTLKVKY